jgi:peptide/nickel transport system substrate-binding protein
MLLRKPLAGLAACALILTALTACTSDSGSGSSAGGDDATVVLGITSDPGALDPQMSIVGTLYEMNIYAYDSIVAIKEDGTIVSNLAESWTYDGSTATFTIKDGITCSDGSAMTAEIIAANINFMSDMNNGSPLLGSFLPAGITATGDNATRTVTFDLAAPTPFLLETLPNVPIVCEAALADRSVLTAGTLGTGPYVLTEAVVDDHYTYTRRDGYTWGPDGATTDAEGMPKYIKVQVVGSDTTAVNMLLTGDINMAEVSSGPDGQRAEDAGIPFVAIPALIGETWYHHGDGHPTSDFFVREALVEALDFDALNDVISGGRGELPTQMEMGEPCHYDATSANWPGYSTEAARASLEKAGYTANASGMYEKDGQLLTIRFYYLTDMGQTGTAAAELALSQWTAAGFTIDMVAMDVARFTEIFFGTGEWDVAWAPINLNSPDQFMGYLMGPNMNNGGGNFSEIMNEDYNAYAAEATTLTGQAACDVFAKAESALFANYDLTIWSNQPWWYFLYGMTADLIDRPQATSFRVTAS